MNIQTHNVKLSIYTRLISVDFRRKDESSLFTVEITLTTNSYSKGPLKLICYDANEIIFKPQGNVLFLLTLSDISARQWQDYGYELHDVENGQITFLFKDFEIIEHSS